MRKESNDNIINNHRCKNNSGSSFVISSPKNGAFLIFCIVTALCSALFLLVSIPSSIGTGYFCLFLLPIMFVFMTFVARASFDEIPQNIGITILFFLEYMRLVVSPVFVVIAEYYNVITYNASQNNPLGIMLMIYEAMCITLALSIRINYKFVQYENIDNRYSNKKMTFLVILILIVTIVICYYAPEIFRNYRSITGVFSDNEFTHLEQSYIVNKYSTSTFKKLMLVLANYVLKVVRLLVPAYLMIQLVKRSSFLSKALSWVLVASPFLLVDGAIARSLYLSFFLLLLYNYLYGIERKKLFLPVIVAVLLVVVYFGARYRLLGSTSLATYIADKSVDYFAGANIVGASFNLPNDFFTRIYYLSLDILRSIPFANTIFGLNSGDYVQSFFNAYNYTAGGQIPTTVGMGSYYFSPFFAPLFSMIFTVLCKKYGRKYIYAENPYYKLVYIYMSFICALGVGMYNIEITLGAWVQIILPLYLVARIAYPRKRGYQK